jgi:hypothetical protein
MELVTRIVVDRDPEHRGRGAAVVGQQHTATAVRPPSLLLLMSAVMLVLSVSCPNVSVLVSRRGD